LGADLRGVMFDNQAAANACETVTYGLRQPAIGCERVARVCETTAIGCETTAIVCETLTNRRKRPTRVA